jgi:hypothetical protein
MVKNAISQIHLKRYIIGACGTGNPSCNNLLMYGSGRGSGRGSGIGLGIGSGIGSGDTSTPPPTCPSGDIPYWTGKAWTCMSYP